MVSASPYGGLYAPGSWGSGGGGRSSNSAGRGGGRVKMQISGNLAMPGRITANGQAATVSRVPIREELFRRPSQGVPAAMELFRH